MMDWKSLTAVFAVLAVLFSCSAEADPENGGQGGGGSSSSYRLTVDGKPFLMLGAQLRTDYFMQLDGRSVDNLDDYFALAAGLNITCVQVPVAWRDVETGYDEYSDRIVRAYIDYCEKYGMKLEILWFGSYMCGYSVEGYIPAYVIEDTATYPELKPSAAYKGWLGKQFYLKPGNTQLVSREVKAVSKMMQFISEYDKALGNPHTVIGVQIENEPDMLATRHNAAHGYSPTDLWPSLLYHLNEVGKAVKQSGYSCYTRVNQTVTYDDWVYWSRKIAEREGIDYVGFDPYVNDVTTLAGWLSQIQQIDGNFSHVAENGGEYMNNDILTLKSLTMGCGYEVFEVITTPHPYLVEWTLRGVYNPDFTPKSQTQRLIDAYGIFRAAWWDFATASPENMAGFNLGDSSGRNSAEETASTTSCSIRWKTTGRGVAFAIEGDGYLTVASTKQDTMYPDFTPLSVESGSYDADGRWVRTADASQRFGNGMLLLEPCTVYRLKTH